VLRATVFVQLQRKCNQKNSLSLFIVNLRARTLTATSKGSVNAQKRVFVFCGLLISGFQVFSDTLSSTICYTQRSMFVSVSDGPNQTVVYL
jgi:hypothetical protein